MCSEGSLRRLENKKGEVRRTRKQLRDVWSRELPFSAVGPLHAEHLWVLILPLPLTHPPSSGESHVRKQERLEQHLLHR